MDLVNSARARGYKVTSSQISRILSREQEGGIDAVIAIAHGLGISREEVFRERGWLLKNAGQTVPPDLDPEAVRVAEELCQLPIGTRQTAIEAVRSVIEGFRKLVGG